jgi:hypothetical protein
VPATGYTCADEQHHDRELRDAQRDDESKPCHDILNDK